RNLNITYIVMNNGCYGLTKGQDSATADVGSVNKSGAANMFQTIDLAALAIELGATFVGRSFSGDKEQLIPMIKAAISHQGFAFIDVLSPCVTFNNNAGSTKSYDYVRDHLEATAAVDYVPVKSEITVQYEEGSSKAIRLHDESVVELHKLAPGWDPTDQALAYARIHAAREKGEILTGIIYLDPKTQDLHQLLDTDPRPLNSLTETDLCPGQSALEQINAENR
ncbi:MAG: 2-oxoacid:ferredoxin oxidoreductase subunit beta, partial [Saprospiraceae bacterium]|nr:2-oxoacid:ferredoxin oxidoreductase subunit beta [Saprospiraceae bacterium]